MNCQREEKKIWRHYGRKVFCYAAWRLESDWGFWFRIFGYGMAVSTMTPMFSERFGYRKIWRIGRVKIEWLS